MNILIVGPNDDRDALLSLLDENIRGECAVMTLDEYHNSEYSTEEEVPPFEGMLLEFVAQEKCFDFNLYDVSEQDIIPRYEREHFKQLKYHHRKTKIRTKPHNMKKWK